MKRPTLLLAATVTVVLAAFSMTHGAVPAAGQTDNTSVNVTPTAGGELKISGIVVTDENNIVTIRTNDGQTMTFRTTEKAFVPINMGPGSPVEVTYRSEGSENVSDRILMAYMPEEGHPMNLAQGAVSQDSRLADANSYAARYDATRYEGDQLPTTAGPLPLAGLAGLLSVAAGLGVRNIRRR